MSAEHKEVGFKVARCSAVGISAVQIFCAMLCDVFEDGRFPRDVDGEFRENAPEYFEEDDFDHLRTLYRRIEHFLACDSRGCGDFRRVTLGYAVLCDPANELIDPEKDYLAPHPASFQPILAMNELLAFVEHFTHDQVGPLICICDDDSADCLATKAEALIAKWKPAKESGVTA